ncbi:MAG TPA: glucosylceramidase [Balneolaceae bacterium]|nr:glucosylceramidase [Balneolaceae bacterium]
MYKISSAFFLIMMAGAFIISCKTTNGDETSGYEVTAYFTSPDKTYLLEKLDDRVVERSSASDDLIDIEPDIEYQTMDGFGYALTGGSAMLLHQMSASARQNILNELFGAGEGELGISYLRVSIGASDLDPETFSYNDLPAGQTDTDLSEFSIDPDKEYLIPILKEILQINPDIKIMGSPWSAPVWMKTGADNTMPTRGGELNPIYHEVYANYFVKYIQAMAEEGITIDAITIQNEPHHPGNNPSMYMGASQQASFIKEALGPAFENAGIQTKIVIWDHNCDEPEYPISILNDPNAKAYIDGSAFHLYGGEITALSTVKSAHPDKNLYFTEQWIGAPGNFSQDLQWNVRNLIIGATRNWSKNVLQWNLAADQNQDPHTDGGCTSCLGAITINGDNVTRNPGYYTIGQGSKLVRPGSIRIESNEINGFENVVFKREDGSIVVILLSTGSNPAIVDLGLKEQIFRVQMNPGEVASLLFEK